MDKTNNSTGHTGGNHAGDDRLHAERNDLLSPLRRHRTKSTDHNSETFHIGEELVDILIYICAIANRSGIDLEDAFRAKEEINKKRMWR